MRQSRLMLHSCADGEPTFHGIIMIDAEFPLLFRLQRLIEMSEELTPGTWVILELHFLSATTCLP